jgi:hypothetical protein
VGARLSALVQTRPGPHPLSCTIGTGSLFQGVKRPWRDLDHPLSSPAVKERVELYRYPYSETSWRVAGWTVNTTCFFHVLSKLLFINIINIILILILINININIINSSFEDLDLQCDLLMMSLKNAYRNNV